MDVHSAACDKGPALDRIERKLDALTDVITRQAVQDNQINHIVDDVEDLKTDVSELVTWRAKWGGAAIALGAVGSFLSGMLMLIQIYRWITGG